MDCTCDEQCPDSTSCMCIFTYDDGICDCECTGPIVITAGRRRLPLYSRVDINVRAADLTTVGQFLNSFCDTELLIPASKASQKVALSLKDVTLENVIKDAGLVIRNDP